MNDDISISMIIDNDIKKPDNEILFKPLPMKNNLNIDERKVYSWVDDNTINNCYSCNIKFSIINRKHHCRNCGKIFCNVCSNHFIRIPDTVNTVNKQYNYLDYKTYLDFLNLNNESERVCYKCNLSITELYKLSKIFQLFDILSLSIKDYKIIACVCKVWNKVSKYYYNKFREIQYNFPDHEYNNSEIELIKQNAEFFKGHSKWLLQLIYVTNWNNNDIENKEQVLKILKSNIKSVKCWNLMCSRSCSYTLDIEDIVIILSKNYTYAPLLKHIIKLLTNIVNTNSYNISIQLQMSCYLYVIVNSLHFYKNYTNICVVIENFLLEISNKNTYISNQLFWMLTSYITNPVSSLYFKNFRQKLVKQLDENTYSLFQNGFDLTQNIIQVAVYNNTDVLESIKNYLQEYNTKIDNFVLPINIEKSFKSINYNNIRMIDSKTKPIILPCVCYNQEVCNIMLKKEDVRKEEIIMKIIKLMDYFIKTEENLDLKVTTYNILPISPEYGYIEFVSNSTTLYDIKELHKFSIQNWIIEKNSNISIHEFRDNISKSCAFYCIVTYLLGIGDRHLDNIMITHEGKIFHIDFAYILGDDPKVIGPEIRLTPDMIDAMGGINSMYYNKFKEYCGTAYNCIRRHSSIFYILLSEIGGLRPIKYKINNEIKYYIINRFIPGENYEEAVNQINNRISMNSNTYSENLIDYFHKKYKISDNDKGIINITSKIVKNTWKKYVKKSM